MIAFQYVPTPAARMLNTLSFIVAVVVAAASHCRLPNIMPICRSLFTLHHLWGSAALSAVALLLSHLADSSWLAAL